MNLQIALSFEWRLGQLGCTQVNPLQKELTKQNTRSAELVGWLQGLFCSLHNKRGVLLGLVHMGF